MAFPNLLFYDADVNVPTVSTGTMGKNWEKNLIFVILLATEDMSRIRIRTKTKISYQWYGSVTKHYVSRTLQEHRYGTRKRRKVNISAKYLNVSRDWQDSVTCYSFLFHLIDRQTKNISCRHLNKIGLRHDPSFSKILIFSNAEEHHFSDLSYTSRLL